MKTKLVIIVLVCGGALLAFGIWQWNGSRRTGAVSLPESQGVDRGQAPKRGSDLAEQNYGTSNGSPAIPTAPGPGNAPMANSTSTSEGKTKFGSFFAKMMDDPETRRYIRDKEEATVGQIYEPLIKSLQMNPAEAAKFKELLTDKVVGVSEGSDPRMSLTNAVVNKENGAVVVASDEQSIEQQIKELVGEKRYAQYRSFQTSVPDRMRLNLFRQQLNSTDQTISDEQLEQLLEVIKEARQNLGVTAYAPPGTEPALTGTVNNRQGEGIWQRQDGVNQHIYSRAQRFLSPRQFEAFTRFQTNQLDTIRMGVTIGSGSPTDSRSGVGP